MGDHHGHVVGSDASKPLSKVDEGPGLSFLHKVLHHVLDLPISDTLVASMSDRREELRVGKPSQLTPVMPVRRNGQAPVSACCQNVEHQALWPRRKRRIVRFENLLGCCSSGHHQAWLLTCKSITITPMPSVTNPQIHQIHRDFRPAMNNNLFLLKPKPTHSFARPQPVKPKSRESEQQTKYTKGHKLLPILKAVNPEPWQRHILPNSKSKVNSGRRERFKPTITLSKVEEWRRIE